jgi:hypothetical protein
VTTRLEAARTFGNDELGEVSRRFNIFMDELQEILRGVAAHSHKLTSASQQLLEASEQITANSGETAVQSNSASKATQQVTENWQSLSTGAGEMTATVQSIAANAHEAAKVASSAVSAAQSANATIAKLGPSRAEIGLVIKVIASVAQQTNLLALNATIEASEDRKDDRPVSARGIVCGIISLPNGALRFLPLRCERLASTAGSQSSGGRECDSPEIQGPVIFFDKLDSIGTACFRFADVGNHASG